MNLENKNKTTLLFALAAVLVVALIVYFFVTR